MKPLFCPRCHRRIPVPKWMAANLCKDIKLQCGACRKGSVVFSTPGVDPSVFGDPGGGVLIKPGKIEAPEGAESGIAAGQPPAEQDGPHDSTPPPVASTPAPSGD